MSFAGILDTNSDLEEIVINYQNGDSDAFQELVREVSENGCVDISFPISSGFFSSNRSDVIYSGFLIGLEKAAKTWDKNKGDFVTYAHPLINQGIKDEIIFDNCNKKFREEWTMRSLNQDLGNFTLLDFIGESSHDTIVSAQSEDFEIHELNELKPLDRSVMYLLFTQNLRKRDISERLGIDVKEVEKSVRRLKTKFRKMIDVNDKDISYWVIRKEIERIYEQSFVGNNITNRFVPIPTEKLREAYRVYLEKRKSRESRKNYCPIQVYDNNSKEIIREVLATIDPNEKSLKRALQERGFRSLLTRTGVRKIIMDLEPDRIENLPLQKYRLGEESKKLFLKLYKRFLYSEIKDFEEADRLNSRERKVRLLVDYLKNEKRLSIKMDEYGLNIYTASCVGDSYKSLLLYCDRISGDNLFDRNERYFVPSWLIRKRGMWEQGKKSEKLVAIALQDVLWDYDGTSPVFRGYRYAEEIRDRATMTNILKNFFRKEKKVLEFLIEKGLGKVLDSLNDMNPSFNSKSYKLLFMIYDRYFNLKLFDRNEKHYVPLWLIGDKKVWNRGEESKNLALEEIQDVLWEIKGYREAEESCDKSLQLRILDEELFKKNPNLVNWFIKMGLGGLMDYFVYDDVKGILKRRSPYEILRFYDKNKNLGWFDESSYPVIRRSLDKRVYVAYDEFSLPPPRKRRKVRLDKENRIR